MADGNDLVIQVSIRASRAGGDLSVLASFRRHKCFNPRLPRGRRQRSCVRWQRTCNVSIRASRAGGDASGRGLAANDLRFNPRLPRGRRPDLLHRRKTTCQVSIRASRAGGDGDVPGNLPPKDRVSIRASRAGGDELAERTEVYRMVSIRASRAGGDRDPDGLEIPSKGFNPRLPRGRRPGWSSVFRAAIMFQSAPPAREATPPGRGAVGPQPVSIRASRAGGDAGRGPVPGPQGVSIRASRAGGDHPVDHLQPPGRVSIRASRAGGDSHSQSGQHRVSSFNPRLPRGRRHEAVLHENEEIRFQSAPPAREATRPPSGSNSTICCFNPRLPRGRRRHGASTPLRVCHVSIRASRAGGDPPAQILSPGLQVSIRASRAGGDQGRAP